MLPVVSGEFRLGGDPELRFAPSGVAVCSASAAASSRKKDGDKWVDDKTTWVRLTAFRRIAENMAESLHKGDLVMVTGKLQVEDWESGDKKGRSVDILVDSIGPSLSVATATIRKGERSSSSSSSSSSDGDPWATPPQDDEPPF